MAQPIDNIKSSLQEIAQMAYGVAYNKGKSGGNGNIGMINGHVVKFNTHAKERGGQATNEQLESCRNLRKVLLQLVEDIETRCADGQEHDSPKFLAMKERIGKIRESLGLPGDGGVVGNSSLLTRKVVAKAITGLVGELNVGRAKDEKIDIWRFDKAHAPKTMENTSFEAVNEIADRIDRTVLVKSMGMNAIIGNAMNDVDKSLRECCDRFGLTDKKSGIAEAKTSFTNEMSQLTKEIRLGTVDAKKVVVRVREAFKNLVDTVVPVDDYGNAQAVPGAKGTARDQVQVVRDSIKRAIPTGLICAFMDLSDAVHDIRNGKTAEIPVQSNAKMELLRETVKTQVERMVGDARTDFDSASSLVRNFGTFDKNRIADLVFRSLSQDKLVMKILGSKPHEPKIVSENEKTQKREGSNQKFIDRLTRELADSIKASQKLEDPFGNAVQVNFAREIPWFIKTSPIKFQIDGEDEVNLSDMPDQELKADDERLKHQQAKDVGNGMQLSRSLLHYFDTKVRDLLPEGEKRTKLYNPILHLITTALSPGSGFPVFVNFADFDGNGVDLVKDTQQSNVVREPGIDRPAEVRITKDDKGEWQIVLTQTLPIGAKITKCKDVDSVDSNDGREYQIELQKFYLHNGDLKFTMTIPLDQEIPQYKKDAPLVPQYKLKAELVPVSSPDEKLELS